MIAQMRTAIPLAVLTLLGLQAMLPGTAAADESIAIYPVMIQLDDGLRGAEYFRSLTVANGAEGELRLSFIPVGEIDAWLSVFAPDDLETPLEDAVVPPESELRLMLRITVPEDAPNALHQGGIQFQGTAYSADGAETGLGASIGIGAVVTINVTGDQNLSGVVQDAWINDIEVDRPPARLQVRFENNGNIQATPTINWQIRDASGREVGAVSHSETLVRPGETSLIVSEWDSAGQPVGEYTADISVLLGDETIDQRQLTFQVLPYGTLTRAGVLEGIRLEGDPRPGGLALFAGIFRNTGEIDTTAVFTAEVYFDNQLIEIVESRERVVIVGEQARLEAVFEVPEEGEYQVRGKVFYEGRETESIELEFTAEASDEAPASANVFVPAPAEPGPTEADQPLAMYLIAGLGAVAVVGGLAFYFGRSRSTAAAPATAPVDLNQRRLGSKDKQAS